MFIFSYIFDSKYNLTIIEDLILKMSVNLTAESEGLSAPITFYRFYKGWNLNVIIYFFGFFNFYELIHYFQ